MANDSDLNGSIVDQLQLLNDNLKEDLENSKKEKKERRNLTTAIEKLGVPLLVIKNQGMSFAKEIGQAAQVYAGAGRALQYSSSEVSKDLNKTGLSFSENFNVASAAFKAGIRMNEASNLEFLRNSKLLGKDTAGLIEHIKLQTDLLGFSAKSSTTFTRGLVDFSMKWKIGSDALINALLGLKDAISQGSMVFGPEIARSMHTATTELTSKYGSGAAQVIAEVFSKTIGDSKGWDRLNRLGISLSNAPSSDELVQLFESVKATASSMGRLDWATASAQLEITGLTSGMFQAAFLKAQNVILGSGFDKGVDIALQSPAALWNNMANTLKEAFVPGFILLFESLAEILPSVIEAFTSLLEVIKPPLIEAFTWLAEKLKGLSEGILNWKDSNFGDKASTVAKGVGLLFLISSTFRKIVGALLKIVASLATAAIGLSKPSIPAVAPRTPSGAPSTPRGAPTTSSPNTRASLPPTRTSAPSKSRWSARLGNTLLAWASHAKKIGLSLVSWATKTAAPAAFRLASRLLIPVMLAAVVTGITMYLAKKPGELPPPVSQLDTAKEAFRQSEFKTEMSKVMHGEDSLETHLAEERNELLKAQLQQAEKQYSERPPEYEINGADFRSRLHGEYSIIGPGVMRTY